MARALGHDAAERLTDLAAGGTPERIELRSMPMNAADRAGQGTLLGTGGVTATIDGNGRTAIRETAFPGVCRLAHHDVHGALLMEETAVTGISGILRADPVDMTRGAARPAAALSAPASTPEPVSPRRRDPGRSSAMPDTPTVGDMPARRGLSRRALLRHAAWLTSILALPTSMTRAMAQGLADTRRLSVIWPS